MVAVNNMSFVRLSYQSNVKFSLLSNTVASIPTLVVVVLSHLISLLLMSVW